MATTKYTIAMHRERETKGTWVYAAPEGSAVKGIYVQKGSWPEYPEDIEVVISPKG